MKNKSVKADPELEQRRKAEEAVLNVKRLVKYQCKRGIRRWLDSIGEHGKAHDIYITVSNTSTDTPTNPLSFVLAFYSRHIKNDK